MVLSLNLSARDLLDAELPARLEKRLLEQRVPAEAFCLEITEGAFLDDPQRAGHAQAPLADGLQASIDDFGAGLSSYARLKQLPVDELKIDTAFVRNMDRDPVDAKLVRSMIELAHNLGFGVVAEGVENARTWEAARAELRAGAGLPHGPADAGRGVPRPVGALGGQAPPARHGRQRRAAALTQNPGPASWSTRVPAQPLRREPRRGDARAGARAPVRPADHARGRGAPADAVPFRSTPRAGRTARWWRTWRAPTRCGGIAQASACWWCSRPAGLREPERLRCQGRARQGGADLELRDGAGARHAARERGRARAARHRLAPHRHHEAGRAAPLGRGRRAGRLHRERCSARSSPSRSP